MQFLIQFLNNLSETIPIQKTANIIDYDIL